MAFQLAKRGFDVQPLAGGLERWIELELPIERRELESRVAAMDDRAS